MRYVRLLGIMIAATAPLVATLTGAAHARDGYPSRLITIVAPITGGTAIDILARLYADRLAKHFGEQVVVLNRAGAGGLVGAQAVAAAAPDGHTLLFANSGHAILGALNKKLPFDPVADFAGVSLLGEAAAVVVVPPSLGVKNLKDFVALARSKPGEINYGSAGIGTSTHLAGAYFARQAGLDLVHVPYTVSATIITDLLGGRIQASFVPLAFVLPLLQDGRLQALAVAAKEPVADPIAIPTASSQGIDYEYATWYGVLAPGKTPLATLETLNRAFAEAGKDPDLQMKVRIQGIEPRHVGLTAFDALIRNDMARVAPLLESIAERAPKPQGKPN
jgi:tripartite-type tricarboxylate transporter receptor subunit TctC